MPIVLNCLHKSWTSRRVDHVHIAKKRDRAAVGDGIRLLRLSLAVGERAAKSVCAFSAKQRHRIPEVWRTGLISNVAQHSDALAIFDLPENLTSKLKVVALLINRVGTIAFDVDAALCCGDHIFF